jgi:hypothetical protein
MRNAKIHALALVVSTQNAEFKTKYPHAVAEQDSQVIHSRNVWKLLKSHHLKYLMTRAIHLLVDQMLIVIMEFACAYKNIKGIRIEVAAQNVC